MDMKKGIKSFILVLFVFFGLFVVADTAPNVTFDKAYEHYLANEYEEANELFLSLVEQNYVSHALYYNLASSYFKMEEYANAMLWFERAKRIQPHDENTNFNINVTKYKLEDKIEAVPELFFVSWFKTFVNMLSERYWAYLSLAFFLLVFVFTAIFLITPNFTFRKYSFYFALIFLLFFMSSTVAAFFQKGYQTRTDEAIVMSEQVDVKSSPDSASSDLFIIHQGIKVKLLDQIGDWVEVKIPNGDKGWMKKSNLEVI